MAYDSTWSKSQANIYSFRGVFEKYVLGGSTWIDNQVPDSNEGADCSAFVNKAWALPDYSEPMTASGHPYITSTYYYNNVPNTSQVDRNYPTFMSSWTGRTEAGWGGGSGESGGHMGLFVKDNGNGTWTTREARGASYGIVEYTRSLSQLISWNYRRHERANWTGSPLNLYWRSSYPPNTIFGYGSDGDRPVKGNWDIYDIYDEPGIRRGNEWYLNYSTDCCANVNFSWGDPGDIPFGGDWFQTSNRDWPGLFRNEGAGHWFLNFEFDNITNWDFWYGEGSDVPLVGDWNDDSIDTPAVVRGVWWYFRNSNTTGVADFSLHFGEPGDVPIVGDWDGDGKDTPGVIRGNVWYLNNGFDGFAEIIGPFGNPGDIQLSADMDGDGQDGTWTVRGG